MTPSLSALFYAAGYLTGLGAYVALARRRAMATSGIFAVLGAGLLGGLIGANAAQWFATGSGGKTVLGGVAGGYLGVVLYKRWLGIVRPTGDLFAVALCAGEAVGRWGCFVGSCCYGKGTELPWAVWQQGAARHPTQVYLSLACLLILGALWRFGGTRPPENALFFLYGLLYCAARFLIEFFRDTAVLAAGLSMAQWACLAGFVFFAVRLRSLRPRPAVSSRTPAEREAAR